MKNVNLQYLLTFKINQDHLETFFSALRSRGGFNDNPSAMQFEASYKRLLVRHGIFASEKGNCLINDIQILYVTSTKKAITNDLSCDEEEKTSVDVFDYHDYLSTLWSLSQFIEDVVAHISEFVVRKLLKNKSMCNVCTTFLLSKNVVSKLTELKNRGNLIFPSDDVIYISRSAERVIRENSHLIFKKANIKQFLMTKVFRSVHEKVFIHTSMTDHIMEQNVFDNHKVVLIKKIINVYIQLRLFYEGKLATNAEREEYVRHKFHKIVHFKHQ